MIAIELKENGKMIGNIWLGKTECDECRELGYILNRNYWHKGYVMLNPKEIV